MSKYVAVKVTAIVSVLSIGAMVTASVAPAAKKKTHKVNMTMSVTGVTGGPASGTTSKSPFGKGKITGTVGVPDVTIVTSHKGGKITWISKDAHLEGTNIIASFKLTKGTGKFKGISGKVTAKAPLTRNSDGSRTFTYKGKAKY